MKFHFKLLILALFQFGISFSHEASQISSLHRALLDGYEKDAKPDGQVSVKFGMEIARINGLCAHKEVLDTQAWVRYMWVDKRLSWNSTKFGGIKSLRLSTNNVWIPDITLYNMVEPMRVDPTNIVLMSNGQIIYIPRTYIKTYCNVNYENWPWGKQNCTFKAGSWTFDMAKLDIQPYGGTINLNNEYEWTEGGPLSFTEDYNFMSKNQVEILGTQFVREEKTYPCCPDEIYPNMEMSFQYKMTKKFKDGQLLTP